MVTLRTESLIIELHYIKEQPRKRKHPILDSSQSESSAVASPSSDEGAGDSESGWSDDSGVAGQDSGKQKGKKPRSLPQASKQSDAIKV